MVETTSSRFKTMTVLTVGVCLSPLGTQMSTLVLSRLMLSQALAASRGQLSSHATVEGVLELALVLDCLNRWKR